MPLPRLASPVTLPSSSLRAFSNDHIHISLMIEETSGPTPFCVVGDMNAELPVKATMQHNWYKQRPFNRHSVLLYDFLCDHELFICNGKRNMNDFTYSKGATSTYIDYIAINSVRL